METAACVPQTAPQSTAQEHGLEVGEIRTRLHELGARLAERLAPYVADAPPLADPSVEQACRSRPPYFAALWDDTQDCKLQLRMINELLDRCEL